MGKEKWGTKRQCQTCGGKFYDMNKTPAICPNCGAAYEPKPVKAVAAAVAQQPDEAKPPDEAAPKADALISAKTTGDAEAPLAGKTTTDTDGANGDFIEDVSELGEDEDDMAEVLDAGIDKKEAQP